MVAYRVRGRWGMTIQNSAWREGCASLVARVVALGAMLTGAGAVPALAQQADSDAAHGVMEQPRPDYDAQGVAVGDWLFLPSIATTANYDDNVFRLRDDRASDWFFETTPIVRLQRKTDAWQMGISANADTFVYSRLSRLNLTDWTVATDFATTGDKSLTAVFGAYYGEYHEGFESADILGRQLAQTRYFRGHVESGFNYQPGEWALTAAATFDTFAWQPTALLDGEHVSNRDRDENLFTPNLRFSYNLAPGYQLFARATYDDRDFAAAVDRFGVRRSSSGYRLDGGLAVAIGAVLRGEAFAGYLRQNFPSGNGQALPDISLLDYGADVQWYPSPDVTVHLTAARALSDIILPGVSVSDDRTVGLSVDWQLRNNVIVQGAASYTASRLVGISRTDDYPSAGITLRYLIDRFVSLEAAYAYTGRRSDVAAVAFDDRTFTLGVNLHI